MLPRFAFAALPLMAPLSASAENLPVYPTSPPARNDTHVLRFQCAVHFTEQADGSCLRTSCPRGFLLQADLSCLCPACTHLYDAGTQQCTSRGTNACDGTTTTPTYTCPSGYTDAGGWRCVRNN